MIKAISFDFWNTLFTEQPGGFRLYQDRRLELLREAVKGLKDHDTSALEQAFLIEHEAHTQIWIEEERTRATLDRVRQILEHLDVELPQEILSQMVSAFEEGILEHPPVLIPGARETVKTLSQEYKLGIISDVGYSPGRVLRQLLEREGLIGVFQSLIFSDEAGRSKPNNEVFALTLNGLEVAPHELVHIGDLEHTDIAGAKRAGCYAIRFTGATPMGDNETTQADAVTDDYALLSGIISSLVS